MRKSLITKERYDIAMSMVSVRAAELCNRQRRVAGEITEFNKMAVDARRAPRLQQL